VIEVKGYMTGAAKDNAVYNTASNCITSAYKEKIITIISLNCKKKIG